MSQTESQANNGRDVIFVIVHHATLFALLLVIMKVLFPAAWCFLGLYFGAPHWTMVWRMHTDFMGNHSQSSHKRQNSTASYQIV